MQYSKIFSVVAIFAAAAMAAPACAPAGAIPPTGIQPTTTTQSSAQAAAVSCSQEGFEHPSCCYAGDIGCISLISVLSGICPNVQTTKCCSTQQAASGDSGPVNQGGVVNVANVGNGNSVANCIMAV